MAPVNHSHASTFFSILDSSNEPPVSDAANCIGYKQKKQLLQIKFREMNIILLYTIPPVESVDVQAIYLALP